MSYSYENLIYLECDVCGVTEEIAVDHSLSLDVLARDQWWILASRKRCFCTVECFQKQTKDYGTNKLTTHYGADLIGRLDAFYRDQHGMNQ